MILIQSNYEHLWNQKMNTPQFNDNCTVFIPYVGVFFDFISQKLNLVDYNPCSQFSQSFGQIDTVGSSLPNPKPWGPLENICKSKGRFSSFRA